MWKCLSLCWYADDTIRSHNDNSLNAISVNSSRIIPSYLKGTDVVGIDEAQFFDNDLSLVAEELALKGIRVIIAGLDMDFKGNSFGSIPNLLARADYITKLHAICVVCGNIANYSYRKTEDLEKILIGDKDKYEPRCRICFNL
jgi:thymidine kinase